MPTRILIPTLVAISSFAFAPRAEAIPTLLGETLTFQYCSPDLSTPVSSQTVKVTAGTSDLVNIISPTLVNPEATSIVFTIPFLASFPAANFSGFAISGFSMTPLLSSEWSVESTTFGWNASHFTVESNRLLLNLAGLSTAGQGTNLLTIHLTPTNNVPDAGSTVLLLGGSLVGLVGLTRIERPRALWEAEITSSEVDE